MFYCAFLCKAYVEMKFNWAWEWQVDIWCPNVSYIMVKVWQILRKLLSFFSLFTCLFILVMRITNITFCKHWISPISIFGLININTNKLNGITHMHHPITCWIVTIPSCRIFMLLLFYRPERLSHILLWFLEKNAYELQCI